MKSDQQLHVVASSLLSLCGTALVALLCCGAALAAAPPAEAEKPRSPAESAKMFHVADGLVWEQVLAEPTIAQPVNMNFDERGRLWVVEYRQYPYPQGLKVLSRDKHWRVQYDKVPKAPPNHERGRDRISIHEDTNGDGQFDKHKVFVDGLNLATAVEIGRGGVWVLNPPYLLFYPDKNRDDVPDGDPVVHLEGFGLSDSHSVVNSLRWGPDGWLYAAQGSTVHGEVQVTGKNTPPVHSMGQLIWRYHPEQRRYEIFAEGGGNAFGVEIDSKGRIFSGHNGGDTRGFHYVQGGYYRKGFSKHGLLSNPYAFGYFPAMKHHDVQRFTHTFVIYEGGALPERWHGKLLGLEPLQSQLVEAEITPLGSTFQTKDLSRPVKSDDGWFRPVDIKIGPDGAVYVADFFERYPSHREHYEGKVFANDGRIYRLRAADAEPGKPFDLAKLTSNELIEKLKHPNRRMRQLSLRVLGDRKDKAVIPRLNELLAKSEGQFALECLWALNLCGGFDLNVALAMLDHNDPDVRRWTVRLLGDLLGHTRLDSNQGLSAAIAPALLVAALEEKDINVVGQLASTAKKLPPKFGGVGLSLALLLREQVDDPHLPLLIWWAIESKCAVRQNDILDVLSKYPSCWKRPMANEVVLPRLMRRFAATGRRTDLEVCCKLFDLAPDKQSKLQLLAGFEEAYAGRSLAGLPEKLAEQIKSLGGGSLALRVRGGDAEAVAQAFATIGDEKAKLPLRLELIEVFGQVRQDKAAEKLLNLVDRSPNESVQAAALAALNSYEDDQIAIKASEAVAGGLPTEAEEVALTLLSSRANWAGKLLAAVEAELIPKEKLTDSTLRRILLHQHDGNASLVKKHWGEIRGATTDQMRAEVARLTKVTQSGNGDPYRGKRLYGNSCAKCHRLFEEGGRIGPNLTSYQRDKLDALLLNIVNPSAEIREGYESYTAYTVDGRVLTGFLADQDPHTVELRGEDGRAYTLARDDVEELTPSPRSIMPEGLLDKLSEQEVRDLMAYLRSRQPLND